MTLLETFDHLKSSVPRLLQLVCAGPDIVASDIIVCVGVKCFVEFSNG